MKQNQILSLVLVAIIFAGGGFFGGMAYQKTKSVLSTGRINNFDRNGSPQNGRFRMGGGQILGDIISSDDKSITVKLADGSSKIVLISSTTNINKAATATIADFKVGERVAAFGVTNSDGSVTAQNIQLNPIMRGAQVTPTITPTK